jgi:hypothetical protein
MIPSSKFTDIIAVDWRKAIAAPKHGCPNNRGHSAGPISMRGCVHSIEDRIQKEHAN